MNLDDLTLGELYAMRDKLRAKLDLRNGGVQERSALLRINKQIRLTEAGRRQGEQVLTPPVMVWRRGSVWI